MISSEARKSGFVCVFAWFDREAIFVNRIALEDLKLFEVSESEDKMCIRFLVVSFGSHCLHCKYSLVEHFERNANQIVHDELKSDELMER